MFYFHLLYSLHNLSLLIYKNDNVLLFVLHYDKWTQCLDSAFHFTYATIHSYSISKNEDNSNNIFPNISNDIHISILQTIVYELLIVLLTEAQVQQSRSLEYAFDSTEEIFKFY